MANQNDSLKNEAATERVSAPETVAPQQYILPRNKRVGRYQSGGFPVSHRHPQVRGGVCEFCGVLDPNQPSQYQYKLCPHYRGMNMVCDYCGGKRDQEDVVYHSTLNIHDHPENPDLLVIRCDAYECVKAHEQRFKVGA